MSKSEFRPGARLPAQFGGGGGATNRVAPYQGFHISYDPRVGIYGCETTALVLKNHVFLILAGDHSEAMNTIAGEQGISGCVDYLVKNINCLHCNSEHKMITGIDRDQFNLTPTAVEVLGQEGIDRIKSALENINGKTSDGDESKTDGQDLV